MAKIKHVIILFDDGGFAIAAPKLISVVQDNL